MDEGGFFDFIVLIAKKIIFMQHGGRLTSDPFFQNPSS